MNFVIENFQIQSLANKQDQSTALDESEIVQHFNLEELVNKYHIPCRVVCSFVFINVFKRMNCNLFYGYINQYYTTKRLLFEIN